MRKRFGIVAAAIAVAALTVTGLTLASGSSSSQRARATAWGFPRGLHLSARPLSTATPHITTARTIVVIARDGTDTFIDEGAPGLSAGDRDVFHNPLFNRDGERVGFVNGDTVFTLVTSRRVNVQVAFTATLFRRGDIAVQGVQTREESFAGAVTGGTGEFQNARGEVHVQFSQTSDATTATFHLIP